MLPLPSAAGHPLRALQLADGAAAADEEEDKELAGVGLAFYAQVFVLKVGLAWRGLRGRATATA